MKHNNYYKEEELELKIRQIEMIQKHYKDYSPENDWVLWIIPELYHQYKIENLKGIIEIKKIDGTKLNIPYCLRKPYPNKNIDQLAMKSGRKRLYGIPLVFKSFEELKTISEIIIKWDVYTYWYLDGTEDPLDLHINNLEIKYQLNFKKNIDHPEYHTFTIYSKDNIVENFDSGDDKETMKKYYDEFDTAIDIDCNLIIGDESFELMVNESYTLKNENINIDIDFNTYIDTFNKRFDEIQLLLEKTRVKDEVQLNILHYEKKETLTAAYAVDTLYSFL